MDCVLRDHVFVLKSVELIFGVVGCIIGIVNFYVYVIDLVQITWYITLINELKHRLKRNRLWHSKKADRIYSVHPGKNMTSYETKYSR